MACAPDPHGSIGPGAGAGGRGRRGAGAPQCAGAPGAGDPYFPAYGNGGYNVRHYDLDLSYDPATDQLAGNARIEAKAKQDLCSFNLDLAGLEVTSVSVAGKDAAWTRNEGELTVTPRRPLDDRAKFRVAVRYGGVPEEFHDPVFFVPIGFTKTSDGANAVGQPESAAGWFPVNDHPRDKASYSFEVTVPAGYEVVANGKPHGQEQRPGGWTAWRWEARTDGLLSGDDRHRAVRRRPLADRLRDPGLRRGRPRDHERHPGAGLFIARAPGGDP